MKKGIIFIQVLRRVKSCSKSRHKSDGPKYSKGRATAFQGRAEDFRIGEALGFFLSVTPNFRLFIVALRIRCGATAIRCSAKKFRSP